jgi:hypothetical protein
MKCSFRIVLSAGVQALGRRQTLAMNTLSWFILPEAVLSTKKLRGGFQFSGGIRNLSNSFSQEPVAMTSLADSIVGDKRTYFLNLEWHGSAERAASSSNDTPSQAPAAVGAGQSK